MRLVQLKIEQDKHLEEIFSFLKREQPDVVCLQEVFEPDVGGFGHTLGMFPAFAPMTRKKRTTMTGLRDTQGVCILSRQPLKNIQQNWYAGGGGTTPPDHDAEDCSSCWRVLLTADTNIEGATYHIGTTHFVHGTDGKPDRRQHMQLPRLVHTMQKFPELLACGDFNMPRGTELYQILAKHYTDHVPESITSTLDPTLHHAAGLEQLVDYIWSTPHYIVHSMRMQCGLSDHCALVAEVGHL